MNLDDLKSSILNNEKVKMEYDHLCFQYQIISELKKLRLSKQMSIEDFANYCEVEANLLLEIDLGKTIPSIEFIQRIVNQTNCKINFKII